jgi:class 3 adenylate cyclase
MNRYFTALIFWLLSTGLIPGQPLDSLGIRTLVNTITDLKDNGEYQKAKQICLTANQQAVTSRDLLTEGMSFYLLGQVYDYEGFSDTALLKNMEAQRIFERYETQLKKTSTLLMRYQALAFSAMGYYHYQLYNYPKALEYYLKSLKLYEKVHDDDGLASLMIDISLFYRSVGDYKNAFDYGFRALAIHEKKGNLTMVGYDQFNIALYYDETGNYDKALDFYLKTIQSGYGSKAIAFNNIANTYKNKKDLPRALQNAALALAEAKKEKDDFNLSVAELTYSEVQLLLNDYANAADHAQASLDLAEKNGYLEVANAAYKCQSEIYEKMNNPDLAYSAYKKYILTKDSLTGEEKQKDITRKLAQYDFTKEQEKRDAVAKAELQRQKTTQYALWGGIALLTILAGVIFRNFGRERRTRKIIDFEKQKSEALLLNILPKHTADELKAKGHTDARLYPMATVLFSDFCDFTSVSENVSPQELVRMIDHYFSNFDAIMTAHGIEKIKTIGDAYVCAAGLTDNSNEEVVFDVIRAARELMDFSAKEKEVAISKGQPYFEQRVGINTGPVVAGVVGLKKFTYDIWGDTVNTAARMEQHGEVNKINISEATYQIVKDHFPCKFRGKVHAKNKGEINMYFVEEVIY